MPEPISIIIPTRDRGDVCWPRCAGCRRRRASRPTRSSSSTTARRTARSRLSPNCGRSTRCAWSAEPAKGISAAQNRGAREPRPEQLLLLNDDTTPADDRLLQGHVGALAAQRPGSALMGLIRYTEEQPRDQFTRFLDEHAQFTFEDLALGPVTTPGRIYTAHLSLRRTELHRAGGFDVRLRFGFEDADLGTRLLAAGVRPVFHPELVTIQDHPMTPRTWAARARPTGPAGHVVNTKDPEAVPLAQDPRGVYWHTLDAAALLLARSTLPLRTPPEPAWRAAFVALNQGAYARGNREAERKARGA